MVNRGIIEGQQPDGQVRVLFNNQSLLLKPENCFLYVAESYCQEEPVSPDLIPRLAEAALAGTVDIVEPTDPNSVWGFVTQESLKFNSQHDLD